MTVEEFYKKRVEHRNTNLLETTLARIDTNNADEEVEEQKRLANEDNVEYLHKTCY